MRHYSLINFDDYGFKVRNINQIAFSSFLSFKIARSYFEYDISDQIFSINTVISNPIAVNEFELIVEPQKLEYLQTIKAGVLRKTGIDEIDMSSFCRIIKHNLNTNYIFNIEFNDNFECLKINTFIDLANYETGEKTKYIVSFQVDARKRQLRLITMY